MRILSLRHLYLDRPNRLVQTDVNVPLNSQVSSVTLD
jgi:hypothetical protein